ncbi:MAG: DUF3857 domain-containing transglutaminase family protein [Deltaproteobacteria bacterium]|nr:DUF3857 domain-containing transglutaminase family protein [Deltaproteobacteria bacterium]
MRLYGVGVVLVVALAKPVAAGPRAFEKSPFTATPAELRAAAAAVAAGDHSVTVLRDESFLTYDDQGRAEQRYRVIARIDRAPGVDDWGTLVLSWSPFYQDKPTVRARVIGTDGAVASYDPSLLHDAPVVSESPSVFSDRRNLEVPMPRLAIGAIIEEEFTIKDRVPLLAAGTASLLGVARRVPIASTSLVVEAPTARGLHVVARGFAKAPVPTITKRAGRTTWTYDLGAVPADARNDLGVPSDVVASPYIGASTGASWAAVAADYQKIVDAKLADGLALPAEITGATPRATVDRAVAWLHAHVRYTGIELNDSAIVPASPAETSKRGFGDCKDKATLLVALLRAAKIPADVVLLSTGPGTDVDRDLPGMGVFDHAIVRARVDGKDLWIDATEDGLPAGQLPSRDQHRRALIIAAGTRDLALTPVAAPSDNLVREVRTVHLADHDEGAITEASEEHGIFWDNLRSWVRDSAHADVTKDLTRYADKHYAGNLVRFSDNAPTDITQPFRLTVEIGASRHAFTDRDHATVWLQPGATLNKLSDLFTSTDAEVAAQVASRTIDYETAAPHAYELEYRIELPPGFDAPTLTPREVTPLGPLSLTTTRRVDGSAIVVTYRLDTGKRRITAAELVAARAAVLKMRDAGDEKLVIPTTVSTLLAQDKVAEAIAESQRLIALHPKEALHWGQLATVYRRAGLISAARRAARQATIVEPTDADAFAILGFELRIDSTQRLFGFDSDRPGAIAALRKALVLNPTHLGALDALAGMLMVDERGIATGSVRDLREAITLLQRAKDTSGDATYDQQLVQAMVLAGSFADAITAVKALPRSDEATSLQVAALAGAGHVDDAVAYARAHAAASDLARLLNGSKGWLLRARAYDAARAVAAAMFAIAPDPQGEALLKRLRHIDVDALDRADPRRPVFLTMAARAGFPVAQPPWDPDIAHALEEQAAQQAKTTPPDSVRVIPKAVFQDLMIAATEVTIDGNARDGWRVETAYGGVKDAFFVELDHGVATLVGGTDLAEAIGKAALVRLDKRDLPGATRWMTRFSDAYPATRPLPGPAAKVAMKVFRAEVARAGNGAPARTDVELAAALLAEDRAPALALPVLRRCAVPGDDVAEACRRTRLRSALVNERWADAEDAASRITAADPKKRAGIELQAFAIMRQRRFTDAAALIDAALVAEPDAHDLVAMRTQIAMSSAVWTDALPWMEKLAARPDVEVGDLNDLAWTRVMMGTDLAAARALAARAEQLSRPLARNLANTLATIEAEADRPVTAWRYALQSWDPRMDHAPSDSDWYVIGRIAESYGLRDDAIAAYRKVKPRPGGERLMTSAELAQRALTRLHAGKP